MRPKQSVVCSLLHTRPIRRYVCGPIANLITECNRNFLQRSLNYLCVSQSVDHLRDERGRLKQQVETLQEKSIGAHMATSKLRYVLSEVSKRADEIEKQLSVAVSDSEWAVCHANCLEAQDAKLRSEIDQLKSDARLSREEAATAQHRLSDAQTISATEKERSAEMELALLAANGANEDLQAQLARALASNSSVSGLVFCSKTFSRQIMRQC